MVRSMRSARVTGLGSIALATLLALVVPTTTCAATEQDEPPALSAPSTAGEEQSAVRAGPRGRPFMNVLGAIPLVTYAGATGARGSEVLTPDDRFATAQLVGAGYVVNPRFR